MRSNTSAARKLWMSFHGKDPREEYSIKASWPDKWGYTGEGVTVYYRSDKWKRDGQFDCYYHDHEGEVELWEPAGAQDWHEELRKAPVQGLPCKTAAVLGYCLGWDVKREGDSQHVYSVEFGDTSMLLCAPPGGRSLFVVSQRSKDVIALFCGGSLDIRPEGIVG